MGGKGSGGKRIGAGRPRKTVEEHALTGDAGRRGRVLAHPSVPPAAPAVVPVVEEFDAPNTLTMEQRHVWLELAPYAFANGTLTKASMAAFIVFCKWVLLERQLADSVTEKGSATHDRAMKFAARGFDAFNLIPSGKPMVGATAGAAPVNEADAFRKAKAHRA